MKKAMLCLLLMICGIKVDAYDCKVNGIYYNLDMTNKTAEVTNKGINSAGYNSYSGAVTIPSSITYGSKDFCVTTIGTAAFVKSESLSSVTIPNTVTAIGVNAFEECSGLISVIIPASVKIIDRGAFTGCSGLTSITIPDNVTTIGSYAFVRCSGLTSIIIPKSVISIGQNAFYNCTSLTSITLPSSVSSIGDYAFHQTALSAPVFTEKSFAYLPPSYKGEYTIPMGVDSICGGAFRDCTSLTSITIPNGIKSIGQGAFAGCTGLANITLPNSVKEFGPFCFEGCSGLTSITIPDSVKTIGWGVFKNCTGLTSINLPNSVSEIGDYAFDGCTGLASIIINLPSKADIASSAFSGCDNLTSVAIHSPLVFPWFAGMTKLQDVELGNEVTSIMSGAFNGCTGLANINLPSKLTTIESNVFNGCKSLSTIELPISLTSIGENAFKGCTGLTSIELPTKLTTIGASAFSGCSKFAEVTIPESVQSLGSSAFSSCTALKSVIIESTKIVSQGGQMSNIFGNQVTNYYVGDKATAVGNNVFGDSNRKSVTLPQGITTLGNTAFGTNTTIKVERGTMSLFTLWNRGYVKPVDVETGTTLPPTSLKFTSSTQTTATFVVDNIYPEYTTTYDGTELKGSQIQLTGLRPELDTSLGLKVALGNLAYNTSAEYTTKSLSPIVRGTASPTAFTVAGTYTEGDAEVIDQKMVFMGQEMDGKELFVGGLEPEKTYSVKYVVTVGYGKNKTWDYTSQGSVTTQKLQLTTLAPKVIAKNEVIVAAKSNITNDDEKVGFEWRRTDAPEEMASRSGEAVLFEGTMEGFLHNLSSSDFWRFRPYYESAAGNKYFGEWNFVEADDDSYFEPTVHTYAYIEVEGNSAEVKGYALRGTDEVTEQGFMYWSACNAVKANGSLQAPMVPSSAKSIKATGQRMTAKITGLEYEKAYNYVAYMKTEAGKTYYGEQQSFTTGKSLVGIKDYEDKSVTEDDSEVIYDVNGLQQARLRRGINIVRFSDGTTRKVMVR